MCITQWEKLGGKTQHQTNKMKQLMTIISTSNTHGTLGICFKFGKDVFGLKEELTRFWNLESMVKVSVTSGHFLLNLNTNKNNKNVKNA